MYSLPEIPYSLLVLDYLKGKSRQDYVDSNGVHQYEKRLEQLKAMQKRAIDLEKDYRHRYKQGSKARKYTTIFLLREFGKVLETSVIYCQFEDAHATRLEAV